MIFVALIGSAVCQFPLTATNYQTQDSARAENIDQNGNVQGQYSYVDPNGKTITVKYTAGKDGFQVQGDHLPVAPQPLQPQNAIPQSYPSQNAIPQSYQPFQNNQFGGYSQSGFPQSFQSYNQQPYQPAYATQGLGQFGNQFGAQNKPLFAPASNPFPAATSGQYDNYRKALDEEREEAQKEALRQSQSFNSAGQSGLGFGQGHRFGVPVGSADGIPQNPYNIQYGADNGYSFEYNL